MCTYWNTISFIYQKIVPKYEHIRILKRSYKIILNSNLFRWRSPPQSSRKSTFTYQITALVGCLYIDSFTSCTHQNTTGWTETRSTLFYSYIPIFRARKRYVELKIWLLNTYTLTSQTIPYAIILQGKWVLRICVQRILCWWVHEVNLTVCTW